VRPGPETGQKPRSDHLEAVHPLPDDPSALVLFPLSEEQQQVIDILHDQGQGMTLRQLETRLSQPRSNLEPVLASLEERQLVARLNTVVPSYLYRYGGVDLRAE